MHVAWIANVVTERNVVVRAGRHFSTCLKPVLCLAFLGGALTASVHAEDLFLKNDKTGKLYGPFEFQPGRNVTIGNARFTVVAGPPSARKPAAPRPDAEAPSRPDDMTTMPEAEQQVPAGVQEVLTRMKAQVASTGGGIVAGRVLDEEGHPVPKGAVFVTEGNGAPLSSTLDDGWFIHSIGRPRNAATLRAGSFYHNVTTFSVALKAGEVSFVKVVVRRPAPESLYQVQGRVTDEKNVPIPNVSIGLGSDLTGGWGVGPTAQTDNNGSYVLPGLAPRRYTVTANLYMKYEGDWKLVAPTDGARCEANFTLLKIKKVTLDYAFQADGTKSFEGGNLRSGQIVFQKPSFGFIFSEGRAQSTGGVSDDLRLGVEHGQLCFRNFMVNGTVGFYDAGAIPLASVKEAGERDYSTQSRPCVAGHVYVVRTFDGHYAKFAVQDIEDDDREAPK